MIASPSIPTHDQQQLLDSIVVRPLNADEFPRCHHLLAEHHFLGSATVDAKTNEPSGARSPAAGSPQGSAGGRWQIPVARELFGRLELDGRVVSLDALHTQDETARALVLEHGADYVLIVKGNQPTVREAITRRVPEPPAAFFP